MAKIDCSSVPLFAVIQYNGSSLYIDNLYAMILNSETVTYHCNEQQRVRVYRAYLTDWYPYGSICSPAMIGSDTSSLYRWLQLNNSNNNSSW